MPKGPFATCARMKNSLIPQQLAQVNGPAKQLVLARTGGDCLVAAPALASAICIRSIVMPRSFACYASRNFRGVGWIFDGIRSSRCLCWTLGSDGHDIVSSFIRQQSRIQTSVLLRGIRQRTEMEVAGIFLSTKGRVLHHLFLDRVIE